MTFSPKRQIICESKNLTGTNFSYGGLIYPFSPRNTSYWVTGGTHTIDDQIGLVVSNSYAGLPIGMFRVEMEAVIEVSGTGYGDTYTLGNVGNISTPNLGYNQLNNNPGIVRDFCEYTIGSKDYVRTALRFDLTVTSPSGLLQIFYANVIDSVPYQKVVITKID